MRDSSSQDHKDGMQFMLARAAQVPGRFFCMKIIKGFKDVEAFERDHLKELEWQLDCARGLRIALIKELVKPKDKQQQGLVKGFKENMVILEREFVLSRDVHTTKVKALSRAVGAKQASLDEQQSAQIMPNFGAMVEELREQYDA